MAIRSQIKFYSDVLAEPSNVICDRITADIPPQMTNLNIIIPILMNFSIFFLSIYTRFYHFRTKTDDGSSVKPNVRQ